MIRTRVGYTGGEKANPTYYEMGNHTEAFQLDFDPKQVSYTELLAPFWEAHHPFTKVMGSQYKYVAFYHDEKQRQLLLASLAQLQAAAGNQVHTEILPLEVFYRAEGYHQKYYLRHNPKLMAELETMFSTEQEFVDSTLAARLSSYSAQRGFADVLGRELTSYGLGEENTAYLLELASNLNEGAGGAACGIAQ